MKKHPADEISEKYSALWAQNANSGAARCIGILSLFVFCTVILCALSLIFILPQENFSEDENRTLVTLDSVSDAENTTDFISYTCDMLEDQFPFRKQLTALNAYCSIALTGRTVNGVMLGKKGQLAEDFTVNESTIEALNESVWAIKTLRKRFESELSLHSTVALCPAPCFAKADAFPKIFESRRYSVIFDELGDFEHIDLSDALADGSGMYFSTDHHWNADGAYLAYTSLSDELGISPYSELEFEKVCVSEEFYGTTWSKSCLWRVSPDCMYVYRYSGDESFTISGDAEHSGFYFSKYLQKKDKYAYFLGGNYGYIEINANKSTSRPRLLLIKDSYANALVPFLARHFDIIMVDPRYYRGDINAIAAQCDRVLFLFGISSLTTDMGLVNLTF